MLAYGLPVLFALFLWWFATGAILYLDGLPRWTFRRTMTGATLVLIASVAGLIALRRDTSVAGAYLGFLSALGIWGWNEIAFLTGFITGPRRSECPSDARGLRRFLICAGMVIHHELAILLSGAVIVAVSVNAENQVGMATFLVLWGMRLSSKLNLFLGVPNAPVSFLPAHLAYMASAFARRAINPLLPVSILGGATIIGLFLDDALASDATPFDVVEALLLTTIAGLAVIEHLFFVLPIPSETLWNWGKASHRVSSKRGDGFAGLPAFSPKFPHREAALAAPAVLARATARPTARPKD